MILRGSGLPRPLRYCVARGAHLCANQPVIKCVVERAEQVVHALERARRRARRAELVDNVHGIIRRIAAQRCRQLELVERFLGEAVRGNQIFGTLVLNRRVDLHAIDATRAQWRGDAGGTAASSSRNDLVKNCRISHSQ